MANTPNKDAGPDAPGTQLTRAEPKLFLVAGEPSGDRLGGALLAEIAETTAYRARGVGGTDMLAHGLEPLFDMSDLSVMGYADVIRALPRVLWRLRQVVRAALAFGPDAVVLIDNQVFSAMAAARLRRAGYRGAIILYVAPSVWAWKPGRARKIAPLFDEVLAVLPFEPGIMTDLGGPPTTYVGHSAERLIDPARVPRDRGLVVMLPGSRSGELARHLPAFRQVAERVAGHDAVAGFVLPTLPHLEARIAAETAAWGVPVRVVSSPEARQEAFSQAVAAFVSAGTVTLECALMDVPMAGLYVPDWLQMRAYKRWGKPLIGLPNIILGEALVTETAPGKDVVARAAADLERVLGDPEVRARQRAGFARVREVIVNGLPETGRARAAARVLAHLRK